MAAVRAFRFLLEGFLAVRYGYEAKDLLAKHYPAVGLTLAGLLVAQVGYAWTYTVDVVTFTFALWARPSAICAISTACW